MSSESVNYEAPEPDEVFTHTSDMTGSEIADEADHGSSEVADGSAASVFESHMLNGSGIAENAAQNRLVAITTSDEETFLVRWTECQTWEV
jgi:hypothetical protein